MRHAPTTTGGLVVGALCLLLAGCTGGAGPAALTPTADPEPTVVVTFDDTTGALTGNVVDEELVPVAKADVWLAEDPKRSTATNSAGGFALNNVPGGAYRIVVQKIGFEILSKKVDVVVGEVTTVALTLSSMRLPEPFHRTSEQRGSVGCGVGWKPKLGASNGGSFCTPLATVNPSLDKYSNHWTLVGNFTEWAGGAFEMKWSSTQALGGGLALHWEKFSCPTAAARLGSTEGRSPIGIRYNQTALWEHIESASKNGCKLEECPSPCKFSSPVFSAAETLGPGSPADVGVTFMQSFTQYFSEFYLESMPEGFTALPDS